MEKWWKLMESRGTREDTPMKPEVVAHELDLLLADNAIVSTDCGLPYTIAAQLAYPNRQCLAFVGDGGFTMLMAEL